MSGAVPRFTSFRPKEAPTALSTSDEARHHSRESTIDKHESARKISHERRKPEQHYEKLAKKPRREDHVEQFSSRSQDPYSDLFVVDRIGDPKNLTYGSLHRYSIPNYHRTGYGNIVGLDTSLKIDRDESSQSNVMLRTAGSGDRTRSDISFLKTVKPRKERQVRFVKAPESGQPLDVSSDFLPVSVSKKRKRGSESPAEDGLGYRSIDGKAKLSDNPVDPDLESASDSDGGRNALGSDVRARNRNAELSRLVKEDAANAENWKRLIEHQAEMVKPGCEPALFSNAEKRALADMRLSMYQTALKSVREQNREELILGMLGEGSRIWDYRTRQQKWEQALRDASQSAILWTKYLDMVQAADTSFRYEEIKQIYVECLKRLKVAWTSYIQESGKQKIGVMQLHVVLRMTRMMEEAGYTELAMAIWQALIEYYCFRPAHITTDTAALDDFERFWDDEDARVGEQDAKGWNVSHTAAQPLNIEKVINSGKEGLESDRPFASFVETERACNQILEFPGKTLDEVGTEDPFHVILFSDIREILSASIIPDLQSLLDAFLCFFNLPPLQAQDASTAPHSWQLDPLTIRFGHNHSTADRASTSSLRPRNHPTTKTTLFSSEFFPTALPGTHATFLNRSLAQVAHSTPSTNLLEYFLAFQMTYFPDQAPKTAKSLLKQQPSNLRIYNAAALIEARQDRPEKAGKIWDAAVGMAGRMFEDENVWRREVVLLVRHWSWFEMRHGNAGKAIDSLLRLRGRSADSSSSGQSTEGTISLAAKLALQRALQEGFASGLHYANAEATLLFSACLALFTYLTSPTPLPAALEVFDSHCAALQSRTAGHLWTTHATQLLHQSKAELICYHMTSKRPYKPALIRDHVEMSLSLFPHNTILLSLNRQINLHTTVIDNQMRSAARAGARSSDDGTLISWTDAICHELDRYSGQSSGSTAESVRSTFSRALLSLGSPVAHSPSLWYLWFEFEIRAIRHHTSMEKTFVRHKNITREIERCALRLKQVFLDGLRYLPWVKEWVLHGLKTFDDAFDEREGLRWHTSELKRVYNVLLERELRVRTEGLEDMLDTSNEMKGR